MFKYDKSRDLYRTFRDGLFEDAVRGPQHEFNTWNLIPVPRAHTGRMATNVLILKMIRHISREFPGAITFRKGILRMNPVFVSFIGTHQEMESTEQEAMDAWSAMKSLL